MSDEILKEFDSKIYYTVTKIRNDCKQNHVAILLLSETNLDDSFPTAQFSLNGSSKPYRLDRSSSGGGILLYVRDEIPLRLLTDYKTEDNLELFSV